MGNISNCSHLNKNLQIKSNQEMPLYVLVANLDRVGHWFKITIDPIIE